MNTNVPISIITGYLGSGKTTLINHILTNAQGYKIAVIVNDIGEVNIDAELIEKGGVVSSQKQDLVSLSNGCICCTLRKDLIEQIMQLVQSNNFDHIMIEASGICEPIPIAQSICFLQDSCNQQFGMEPCYLDSIISVVDALRMSDEFQNGKALVDNVNEEDVENIVIKQIEFCDVLLLNKSSLISNEKLNEVKAIIKALQPNAKIIETDFSKVDLTEILDTKLFDFEKAISSAGWIQEFENDKQEVEEKEKKHCHCGHHHEHDDECEHHHCKNEEKEHKCKKHKKLCICGCHEEGEECDCGRPDDDYDEDYDEDDCNCENHHHEHHHKHGEHCTCNQCKGEKDEFKINTFVYYRRKPFNKEKFNEFLKKDYGKKIIRTKGLVYFDNDLDTMYIYEQAGSQKVLEENGYFYATLPNDQLAELKKDPKFMEIWDDEFGDRMIKLVFIGQNMPKEEIIDELNKI